MKHIQSDNITTISASSEDTNFPIERVQDEHPKRVYKADASYTAVITMGIIGGLSDIILAGTNAVTVEVEGTDPNEISWGNSDLWGDSDVWGNRGYISLATVLQKTGSDSVWIHIEPPVTGPADYKLTVATTGADTLEIGVIRANLVEDYGADPEYGVNETRVDFSVKAENSNGSRYYKKRDIVRSFSLSAELTRDNAQLLMDSYDTLGEEPTGWKLTDIESADWVVFGRFDGPPTITHAYPTHSIIAWKITEVL